MSCEGTLLGGIIGPGAAGSTVRPFSALSCLILPHSLRLDPALHPELSFYAQSRFPARSGSHGFLFLSSV